MVCTNNKKFYETIKMLRGHGLLRECGNPSFENKMKKKYKNLSPNFIFMYSAFNMRNNEVQAVIGINQLKRLNKNNSSRAKNFKYFLKNLIKINFLQILKFLETQIMLFQLFLKVNLLNTEINLKK